MRIKKKWIILLSIVLFICIWLFRPLSDRELESTARIHLEDALFELNRIDPALFRESPVIKYDDGERLFEWTYRSGSDTLTIGVPVSRCNFGNLFLDRFYIKRNSDMWDRLEFTDPRYANSRPPNSQYHREKKDSLHLKKKGKIGKP